MTAGRLAHFSRSTPSTPEDGDDLRFSHGSSPPADGTSGYARGCVFIDTTAGGFYINEGTETSCDFNQSSALTPAQEALLGATAGVATASKALIPDSSGLVTSGSFTFDDMSAGAGMSGAETLEHRVNKVGGLIKTEIFVDLTGLNAGGTAGDIIGTNPGVAASHLGQITAAKHGTLVGGRLTCLETPAGPAGGNDIDLYSATEATGAEDAAISGLTETALCNSGALSAGTVVPLTALPAANEYLYLVDQGGGDAAYTAGKLLIELWGK